MVTTLTLSVSRFEILGCSSQAVANTSLTSVAQSPGYIGVTWQHPTVNIPDNSEFPLYSSYFLVNVTHMEEEEMVVEVYNISDTSVNIARPLWGAVYKIILTCWIHDVPLQCGSSQLVAEPRPSAACRAHSSFCTRDKLSFLSPKHLTATRLSKSGSVSISWLDSNSGWRAPERVLIVQETSWDQRIISENKLENGNCTITVDSVELDKSYQILFYPRGPNISPHIGQSLHRNRNRNRGSNSFPLRIFFLILKVHLKPNI